MCKEDYERERNETKGAERSKQVEKLEENGRIRI